MKITAISDTHGRHDDLTDILKTGGEVLVHAGDGANQKNPILNEKELIDFLNWFSAIPNWEHKIFVPGNHDTSMCAGLIRWDDDEWYNLEILINRPIMIDGVRFFGSPYTPNYGSGWAWNMKRHRIGHVWNGIPDDTNVLITHGPPQGYLDISVDKEDKNGGYVQCGCGSLRWRVDQLDNLSAHIFGHIHNRTGVTNHGIKCGNGPMFVNASNTIHKYDQGLKKIVYVTVNPPLTFDV